MKTNQFLKAFVCFVFSCVMYAQDGSVDLTFNSVDNSLKNGFDQIVLDMEVLPDNKIVYVGNFIHYQNAQKPYIVRVNPDNTIDYTFNTQTHFNGFLNNVAVQPDGKILVAGYFTQYGDTDVNGFARLNQDGSLDTTFQAVSGLWPGSVAEIKLQQDGKILLGGSFAGGLLRLNGDGSVDQSFLLGEQFSMVTALTVLENGDIIAGGYVMNPPSIVLRKFSSSGSAINLYNSITFNNYIYNIVVMQDGSLLTTGDFSTVNGTNTGCVVKVLPSGMLDQNFGLTIYGTVNDSKLLSDNKILIAGGFRSSEFKDILRLNADGSVDNSFFTSSSFFLETLGVQCLGIRVNKIIAAGDLTDYAGVSCNNVIYLNNDGTVSPESEIVNGADLPVYAISDAGNGNMLLGGVFNNYNNTSAPRLALIDQTGALVSGFNPGSGPNGSVDDILKQDDGKFIVIGSFDKYNNVDRYRITRINANGTLDNSFNATQNFNISGYNHISKVVLQEDGKLVIAGILDIRSNNQILTVSILRLNQDGSLDQGFTLIPTNNPIWDMDIAADGSFMCQVLIGGAMVVKKISSNGILNTSFPVLSVSNYYLTEGVEYIKSDKNGKFYVAQLYRNLYGQTSIKYRRIDANGIFDDFDFTPAFLTNGSIVSVQDDLKFLATSSMYENGVQYLKLMRYNYDGTEDVSFQPILMVSGRYVTDCLYAQDKLVLVGKFTSFNSIIRNHVARVNNTVLGTPEVTKKDVEIIALRKDNKVSVAATDNIDTVKVYDLAGKMVASAKNIKALQASLPCTVSENNVLIVNITLENGSTVIKKIM